jgi:hypothetical protein
MHDIIALTAALRHCWDADSAYPDGTWSADNPARGQCVVSCLIIQDYLGGDFVRFQTAFNGVPEKHYANIIDGTLIDTTRSQFPPDTVLTISVPDMRGFASIRERLFGEGNTRERYTYLKRKVADYLVQYSVK